MKKVKTENILHAAGRHLFRRNYIETEILKKNKLKVKQSPEQFEKSSKWTQNKIISLQNCSITEREAETQYSRLKTWIDSLEESLKIELQNLLFPVFISLYNKLNSSGNSSGARTFYSRNQSNFLKILEYRKMAEKFCTEPNNHTRFSLEVSEESFEALHDFLVKSDHLILLSLFNTFIEVNMVENKIEKNVSTPSDKSNVEASNIEEVQDLLACISKMNKLPPPVPLLKLYTIDTGQHKMCSASVSSCSEYISCGFQDSTVAVWNLKKKLLLERPTWNSLDLSCAVGRYHPAVSTVQQQISEKSATLCYGHSGTVYSTQFTPGDTHLLTASEDTTLRLWNMESLENVVVYRGHTYPVWCLDVTKIGPFFASGSQDRTGKIWSFERTYPLRILAGHNSDVDCIAFHPNGMYVATGSADRSVRMWSVTEGNMVRILPGHSGTVLSVAFSPCGKFLASAGEDRRVKVWDVSSSSILHDYREHSDTVYGVVWISNVLLASYSADGVIRIWNTQHSGATVNSHDTSSSHDELAHFLVPSNFKPAYLGNAHPSSFICIAASD